LPARRRPQRGRETMSEQHDSPVICTTCGAPKCPVGRDAPLSMELCDHVCEGYWEAPEPPVLKSARTPTER